jgi:hypothetical protein
MRERERERGETGGRILGERLTLKGAEISFCFEGSQAMHARLSSRIMFLGE